VNIVCGIDEPRPELPELGLSCCFGATMRGSCTCWRPVYDGAQTDQLDDTAQPTVRPSMCGDCAYRPGSPEKTGDEQHRGDADELERLAGAGEPFSCHDGMRKIVRWLHPSGAEVPGHPADYAPPVVGRTPYRVDGQPAYLCAGWNARRRALTAKGELT
jgi:hypothetical protein